MTDLTQIAKTIGQDFHKAVEAAQRADALQVESIIQELNNSYQDMMDGIERVRGLEIQAANLIKDAIQEREKVEDEYHRKQAVLREMLGKLRGSKLSAPNLKAIEGDKK